MLGKGVGRGEAAGGGEPLPPGFGRVLTTLQNCDLHVTTRPPDFQTLQHA